MPKYTFLCPGCGKSVDKYVPRLVQDIPCECLGTMLRQMPLISVSTVTETVDKYTGTTWLPDHDKLIKERKDEYYWKVEVPRLVNSGTYSVQTMLEQGWIWIDDNDQMQVHSKPPSKR